MKCGSELRKLRRQVGNRIPAGRIRQHWVTGHRAPILVLITWRQPTAASPISRSRTDARTLREIASFDLFSIASNLLATYIEAVSQLVSSAHEDPV